MMFRDAFCETFGCKPDQFELKLLQKTVRWHARPFVSILLKLQSQSFKLAYSAAKDLGTAQTMRDVVEAIEIYHYQLQQRRDWVSDKLKIRLSGRKVCKVFSQIYKQNSGGESAFDTDSFRNEQGKLPEPAKNPPPPNTVSSC